MQQVIAPHEEKLTGMKENRIIGWKEYVELPEWGAKGILAKIDTGALTSALHVASLEELPGGRVRFNVVTSLEDSDGTHTVETEIVRRTEIRPSTGKPQLRYVVEALLRVGGVEKTIEVSLTCRKNMYCRMLIGRKALEDDFLVDASTAYHYGKRKRKKRKRPKRSDSAD
jgi:hypothetical protein